MPDDASSVWSVIRKDGIRGDDFYINAFALWNYSKSQNTKFSFGLAYTNTLGFPAPIHVVNYWKKFNEQWEMNLGFPRTNVPRHLNQNSSMVGYFEFQGYNLLVGQWPNAIKPCTQSLFKCHIAPCITYMRCVESCDGDRIDVSVLGIDHKYQ